MDWIIFTLIWGVLGFVAIGVGALFASGGESQGEKDCGKVAMFIGAPAMFLFWIAVSIFMSVHQVPAGSVGVTYQFGAIIGQTDSGLQVVPPWRTIKNASVQLQTLAFVDDEGKVPEGAKLVGEGLDSFSNETQNVYIDAIVNIEVDPSDVQGLYRNVGPNYVNKLIPGRISQIFKDETVNYAAVDLAPNRELIRANVEAQLIKELAPYSITVKALLIENMAFDAAFETSIVEKQVAQQNALKERELVAANRAKADQRIEDARGEAESLRVTAQGQADANVLISASLTEQLIRFQALQKLADNIQIALIPSGQGIIIDPATLLKPETP